MSVSQVPHEPFAAGEGTLPAGLPRWLPGLLGALPWPPSRIVVRASGFDLEIEWGHRAGEPAARPAQPEAVVSAAFNGSNGSNVTVGTPVCSPTVGTFYRSPEPGAAPFVVEGQQVRAGQQVAIVEAMKLMLPVESPKAGRVTAVLLPDGAAVEFGTPLITVADE